MAETFIDGFQEPVAVADLPPAGVQIHREASEAERAAAAIWLGVAAVDRLTIDGVVTGDSAANSVRFDGRIAAIVTQACVVTLEPVVMVIDVAVARQYQAGLPPFEDDAGWGDDDGIDDAAAAVWSSRAIIDPIDGGMVDPLQAALEELALAVPAHPRRSEAAFGDGGAWSPAAAGGEADARHPFAALASLRRRDGDG